VLVYDMYSGRLQTGSNQPGKAMGAMRDPAQSFRPVVDGVHAGHHGQQHLRGADVARGLLTPNVLLTGLQGEAIGRGAVGVHRHPYEPTRKLSLEARPHGDVAGVRPTETKGHTEALGCSDHDVGVHLARRLENREC